MTVGGVVYLWLTTNWQTAHANDGEGRLSFAGSKENKIYSCEATSVTAELTLLSSTDCAERRASTGFVNEWHG
jgi:hypothetical protein